MKVYKGTDKNMKCRGYQYELGKTEETDSAVLCKSGFHACERPLDVLGYYPPNNSRYFEAEAEDVSPERNDGSKIVCKRLTLVAEIGIAGLVKDHVDYVKEHLEQNVAPATSTGNQSAATSTGDWSAATNTGNQSAATSTGDWSAATNTGDQSAATAGGKGSVAIVTGYKSKARADLGCAICICERDENNNLLAIKAAIVDGETIKADTWYMMVNGEFVEVGEER